MPYFSFFIVFLSYKPINDLVYVLLELLTGIYSQTGARNWIIKISFSFSPVGFKVSPGFQDVCRAACSGLEPFLPGFLICAGAVNYSQIKVKFLTKLEGAFVADFASQWTVHNHIKSLHNQTFCLFKHDVISGWSIDFKVLKEYI